MERIRSFLKTRSLWATAAKIILYVVLMYFLVILPERPHNYKVLSAVILIFGIFFVFTRLRKNKEYSGERFLRLRHENDDVEKMMSLSIGILLIIGSAWYILSTGQFAGGTFMCLLLGSFLLYNGLTYKNTVILKKEERKIIQIDDPEIQIETEKINKLTVHLNQIVAKTATSDHPFQIRFLKLKNEETSAIKEWFLEIQS